MRKVGNRWCGQPSTAMGSYIHTLNQLQTENIFAVSAEHARFCVVIISYITQHNNHAHVFLVSDVTSDAEMIESVNEHICESYVNASF